MDAKKFEKLVEEGIETIPARFLKKMDNVAIVISDRPTIAQLNENGLSHGETLLGLYEGIPITERGDYYGMGVVMPDKITIFKEPILDMAGNSDNQIREAVRDTVWHEIAHYFGYSDDDIEQREKLGKNFSK